MIISTAILYIMIGFMALGALDRCLGNRFGLGAQFEAGFHAMGPLALGMIGMTCMAPLMGDVLRLVTGPYFRLFGADPVMAGSLFLSLDTGAYALAHDMTANTDLANFSAVFLAPTLGSTIGFGIPVALGILKKEDRRYFAMGTLSGIIVIPFSCLIGAAAAGFDLRMALVNIIPVFLLAVLIAVGLAKIPDKMIRAFEWFSKGIVAVMTVSLALAIFSELTGITVVEGMTPISESFLTIGGIAIVLAGAYPLVYVIIRGLNKPLCAVGARIGLNAVDIGGMIASLANTIPAYGMIQDMTPLGKVMASGFITCAAFALGDYLAFCASVEPSLVPALLVCKLSGGVMGAGLAKVIFCRQKSEKQG